MAVKDAIILEAYRLFEQKPFRQVTIESIAQAAGIGKGTLYLFFPSKEHVFVEVMMRFEAQLKIGMTQLINAVTNPKERLLMAVSLGLEATDQSEIYRTLMDAAVMQHIFAAVGESEVQRMAEVDLTFMETLLGTHPLKVSEAIAVDLLRSVFFLRLFENQLLSPKQAFYDTYVRAIVDQIL